MWSASILSLALVLGSRDLGLKSTGAGSGSGGTAFGVSAFAAASKPADDFCGALAGGLSAAGAFEAGFASAAGAASDDGLGVLGSTTGGGGASFVTAVDAETCDGCGSLRRKRSQPPAPITATASADRTRRFLDRGFGDAAGAALACAAAACPFFPAGGFSINVAFGSLPSDGKAGAAVFTPVATPAVRSSPSSRTNSSPVE